MDRSLCNFIGSALLPRFFFKGYKKASLLIRNYQCMKEEMKPIVFLAQKSTHC